MAGVDESTSHPAVRATIDAQARSYFSEVAKDHVTPMWRTVMAAFVFIILGVASGSLMNWAVDQEWVDKDAIKPFKDVFGPGLFFIAATYLVGGLNNRRNRTRFFASALWEIIVREKWRDRFQVERIIQGGKIGSVLARMGAKKNSKIDIQWTFFYREEHSSRLFTDCVENNQKLRILLCKPDSESLLTRVQDMKGDYRQNWSAAHAEISLGNLTFAREFIGAVESRPDLLNYCEVRFSNLYIGRPEVIIVPDSVPRPQITGLFFAGLRLGMTVLGGVMWALAWLWKALLPPLNRYFRLPAIANFLFSHDFASELGRARVGMGVYLTQESSKYPFFIFRPEPRAASSSLVPTDAVDQFDLRWAGATSFGGPPPLVEKGTSGRTPDFDNWLTDAKAGVTDEEERIFQRSLQVPAPALSNRGEVLFSGGSMVTPQRRTAGATGDDAPEVDARWLPGAPFIVRDQIDSLAPSAVDGDDRLVPQLGERELLKTPESPLQNQTSRVLAFSLMLALSFAISLTLPAQTNDLASSVVRISALLSQSVALAILFSVIDPRDLKQQFDGCLRDLREVVRQQAGFGIVNIVEGGKFYDIISQMNVEHGDTILIHWSFLQHEQASEDFAERALRERLDVALLLMGPFSVALRRRTQDLAGVHDGAADGMLSAKSLGNLDFVRRQKLFADRAKDVGGGPDNYLVAFSEQEMGRPMIIVCRKSKDKDGKESGKLEDLVVKQVALGHFLTGESSKYPFIIFGAGTGAKSGNQVCADSLQFFANRWRSATRLGDQGNPRKGWWGSKVPQTGGGKDVRETALAAGPAKRKRGR